MTLIVIGFVLLALTPLIWSEGQVGVKLKPIIAAELQVQVEAWGGQGFLGKTVKLVIKQYEKDQKEEADRLVRAEEAKVTTALKEAYMQIFKNAGITAKAEWGSGSVSYPIAVRVAHEDLSSARKALRSAYGSWNDKVEEVSIDKEWKDDWSVQRNVCKAKYLGPQICDVYYALSVWHEMDAIPEGLLKPGCKIEEDIRYSVTCES